MFHSKIAMREFAQEKKGLRTSAASDVELAAPERDAQAATKDAFAPRPPRIPVEDTICMQGELPQLVMAFCKQAESCSAASVWDSASYHTRVVG